MWVFFNRDKIGVLNEQCGQLYSSISILCSRHRCVCNVFQFQLRFACAVFVEVVIAESLSFTGFELETAVDIGVVDVAPAATADDDVIAAVVVSISHFGHRISLVSNVWHCSCSNIAARVAKRIPQLLTLHLVVMTLFRLLMPSEWGKK